MKGLKKIALIPARGGSKRLPKKNIIEFMGKPMIAWSILAAKKTGIFESVVVSSDDDEILTIAKNYKAQTHERDSTLATDDAKVLDVCINYFNQEEFKSKYELLCVLYPTSPLEMKKMLLASEFNISWKL